MNWTTRIRSAAYVSPSGLRFVSEFEDVGTSVTKKTAAFNFPDVDGTFIQDLGHSDRVYPLRLFFWGPDHDLEASNFEKALLERGPGRLEHPFYGVKTVVPFGAIKRRDDLKTAANQTVFEIAFWETLTLSEVLSSEDLNTKVVSSVSEYNDAAARAFEEGLRLDSEFKRSSFKSFFTGVLNQAASTFENLSDIEESVRKQIETSVASLNSGIDVLVADPLTLAFQTIQLLQLPALAASNINARLTAYADLTNALILEQTAEINEDLQVNNFFTQDLFASALVSGAVLSSVNHDFVAKPEALAFADSLLKQFQAVVAWREETFLNLSQVDTGGAYQKLQEATATATGFLVEIAFDLRQERRVVLTRNRTIIDLAAEFYKNVDSELDFIIQTNDLSGSSILEMKKGQEFVYYV